MLHYHHPVAANSLGGQSSQPTRYLLYTITCTTLFSYHCVVVVVVVVVAVWDVLQGDGSLLGGLYSSTATLTTIQLPKELNMVCSILAVYLYYQKL